MTQTDLLDKREFHQKAHNEYEEMSAKDHKG